MGKVDLYDVEQPVSANERYLHAIVIRQNIIIEQLSSIVNHIATKDEVAITKNTVSEVKPEEVKVEEVKKAPVKRTRKKVE